MYGDDEFNYDDLDGGFYEAAFRSVGINDYSGADEDGNRLHLKHSFAYHPDDDDDHKDFECDVYQDDGLSPVRMESGHDPADYTSLTTQYIDLGDDQVWAHCIYRTDDQDDRELRTSGIVGAYNQGERERRDMDQLLDPGSRKLRDRRRILREGGSYNDRKLAEQINRALEAEAEYELDPEHVELLVNGRRDRTDFQFWIQECGGHKGKPVGERRARQIYTELTEELSDEERDAHPLITRYRAARAAGWLSPREKSQLEPAGKWTADGGAAGQQYDPSSHQYSRNQMASIASQLVKYDGDVTRVIVYPDPVEEVDLSFPDERSAEIARQTEEFLARGGKVEQVESADEQLRKRDPELHRKLKYRWLRWNRW